jgi:hypothetical protein
VADSEIKDYVNKFAKADFKVTLVRKKMGVGSQRMEYLGLRLHVPRTRMEEVPIPEFNTKENLFGWIDLQVQKFQQN